MGKIWEFFENMDEYVYVTDMDSNELLYMNRKALETYGFHSLKEIAGKKCYEVLRGYSAPCMNCNKHGLTEGYFKEWRHYNPVLDKYLALKDTMIEDDGRLCHIEIAMDISAQERQSNMIRTFQNLEAFTSEGIGIALQAPTPDKTIEIIMEYLGKALQGERTYIFEQNEKGGDDNTYEWVANGIMPQKDNLQDLPPEICADWYQDFRDDKNIIIENVENIRKKDPLKYDLLRSQNIHSLVVVPLYDDKRIIGFYGVDNPPVKSLDYAQYMLQIMGHFIVSSLKNRDLVKQLQYMSYCDQLTKIGNRYAMNQYIDCMQYGESIGVVYCDITGLKRVNDTEGHEAGDRLILRACASLKKAFSDYNLFRIGGDELLALCSPIEESVLMEKIGLLKKDLRENSVVMAVGHIWRQSYELNIDRLLADAEKLMYEDKAEYYRNSGLDRRR